MGNSSSTCYSGLILSVTFKLHDNYGNVYAVDPTTNTTKYAESAGSATTFSAFAYGSDNPFAWFPTIYHYLGLNETSASGQTILYLANVGGGADNAGGLITFAQVSSVDDLGSDPVGTEFSGCDITLSALPNGDDLPYTFDCGGKINLFNDTAHPDCRSIALTYTPV